MSMIRCLHCAIVVSNLEEAEQFYSQVLGLEKVERQLKFPGIWYQIGDYQLHLMLNPQAKQELLNQEKWGRNPHIAFQVGDLEEAKARLQSHGYPLQLSSSGRAALFTQDRDGNVIEISQL